MSSNLLINEPPLLFSPTFAKLIGLNEAIFLQQVHYWLNPRLNKRVINGRYWVYNTLNQWLTQFPFFGEKTLRRTIANLEDLKVLISYVSTVNFQKTKFYSIDYDVLDTFQEKEPPKNSRNPAFGQNDQIDLPKRADVENLRSSEGFEGREGALESDNLSDLGDENSISNVKEIDVEELLSHKKQENSALFNSIKNRTAEGTPSGHFDHIGLPERADVGNLHSSDMPQLKNGRNSAYGQNDHIDVVILTRSYNKDTETTTENTLLPPPHSSSSNLPAKEEKEDDDMDFLISVWNGIVQSKLETSPAFLTTKRRITLKSIFTHYFGSDKASWKAYCEKIAGTKFLMGQNDNGFKAGFDWSINPDNIVRIQEGAFYDKPIPEKETSEPSWEEFENALRERQTDKAYPFSWTNVCLSLARQTNQHVSTALFERIHPENLSDSVARLIVPFQFIFDQIRDRHLPKLKAAIRAEYPHVSDVFLEVGRTR